MKFSKILRKVMLHIYLVASCIARCQSLVYACSPVMQASSFDITTGIKTGLIGKNYLF